MLGDERAQLPDQFGVTAEREIGLDPIFDRRHPVLLDPRDLGLRKWLECKLRQHRSSPEFQRLPQLPRCPIGGALSQGLPAQLDSLLEPVEVDVASAKGIPTALGHEDTV
jgi:hypothetical protein